MAIRCFILLPLRGEQDCGIFAQALLIGDFREWLKYQVAERHSRPTWNAA
jgi:hypothetical protein